MPWLKDKGARFRVPFPFVAKLHTTALRTPTYRNIRRNTRESQRVGGQRSKLSPKNYLYHPIPMYPKLQLIGAYGRCIDLPLMGHSEVAGTSRAPRFRFGHRKLCEL